MQQQDNNLKEMLSSLKSTYLNNRDNIKSLLESYGFGINKLYQFVDDKSQVIAPNGYIKQFGSDKGFIGGDVVDFIKYSLNKSFKDVVIEVYSFFNGNSYPIETKVIQQKPKYSLENIDSLMKRNQIPKDKISQLFVRSILEHNTQLTQMILKQCIRWSTTDDSLVYTQRDENGDIQFIAIHRSKHFLKKNKQRIPWVKKKGSSNIYVPNFIQEDARIVFVSVGVKEIILNQLLELDYISFISDSMVKTDSLQNNEMFQSEIKPQIKDKIIIYLVEHDVSSESTVEPLRNEVMNICKYFIPINVNDLYLNYAIRKDELMPEIKKGSDFVDIVNFIGNVDEVIAVLSDVIKGRLRNLKINDGSLKNG